MSRPIVTAAVVAATVVLIAALFYLFSPSTTVAPDGGTVTDADRGVEARETIADLREDSEDAGSADLDEAFARAEAHREAGETADAHILYFFAARNGHSQAAFRYATMHDPLHHDPATSLLQEPDPSVAFEYYMQALEGGVSEAESRLAALRDWAEQEAASNPEAERLLVQWN